MIHLAYHIIYGISKFFLKNDWIYDIVTWTPSYSCFCCSAGKSKLPEARQRLTCKRLYIADSYALINTIYACTGNLRWRSSRGFLFFACFWFVWYCLPASCRTYGRHTHFLWKKFYEPDSGICPVPSVCAPFHSAAHRSVYECCAASGQYPSIVSFFHQFLSVRWRIQKPVQLQDSGLYPQKWW